MANTEITNCGEDRNLLRIRERERRNQEIHQEKELFLDSLPLFGEPYKTTGDELSSRIQSMLGNYEEVKDFISNKSHQDLVGIPKNAVPLVHHGKSDHLRFVDKTSSMMQKTWHASSNKIMGPPVSVPSQVSSSGQFHKTQHITGQSSSMQTVKTLISHSQRPPSDHQPSKHENYSSRQPERNDGSGNVSSCVKLSSPHSPSSLPLPSMSPPAEPLSPLHSNQHSNIKSQNSSNHERAARQTKSSHLPDVLLYKPNRDSSGSLPVVTLSTQPSAQTFPSSLPSKNNKVQQKPTAYVRPMDGLDQMPSNSPELKPTPEHYTEDSYENTSEIKAVIRPSKLKNVSKFIETAFSNDVHCVEEILREMTQSWPAPLTAIHTPRTAELSKNNFPVKEPQHVPAVPQNQKHHDSSPRRGVGSEQAVSMLEDDLQLSESDEDQICEDSIPTSALSSESISEPVCAIPARSSNRALDSSSDTNTSSESDSESESSSTASEKVHPLRTDILEPGPPRVNSWQLDNWLPRVNPTVESNSLSDSHGHQELADQYRTDVPLDHSESHEQYPVTVTRERDIAQADCPSRENCKKIFTQNDATSQSQLADTKQLKKPPKIFSPEGAESSFKKKSESVPCSTKNISSEVKLKVKKDGVREPSEQKQPKPSPVNVLSGNTKHKGVDQLAVLVSSCYDSDREEVPSYSCERPSAPTVSSRSNDQKQANKESHHNRQMSSFNESRPVSDRVNSMSYTLIVKIDLSLLSRIPNPPDKNDCFKKSDGTESSSTMKTMKKNREKSLTDHHRKRKGEEGGLKDVKKLKLVKESKSLSSLNEEDTCKIINFKNSCERKSEPLPVPASSAHKHAKPEHKRRSSDTVTGGQVSILNVKNSSQHHHDSSLSKHRRTDGRTEVPQNSIEPSADSKNNLSLSSLLTTKSTISRPLLKFDDSRKCDAERHIKNAKKLKHKADAMEMTDKVGRAFTYLDAALSFIEFAVSMECDAEAPKSGYTMFSETVDLIKFIMKLKTFADSSSPIEKPFTVLSMRCLSLLYMAMFRHKKDTAMKYSRVLSEHFKNSSKTAQVQSSFTARSTGGSCPLSPPSSSTSCGSSQSGMNASNSSSSSVIIPQMIHQMASYYVSVTSLFLYAHDTWEQAELLAKSSKEFFTELDAAMSPLTLNSSMTELVQYTRQGLHWLRLDSNTQ